MKIKKKPKEIRAEYEKAKAFNQQINLYDTVEKNENFYAGEQWKGVNAPDLDKPVFNILKRVISYFIAMLVSDDIAVSIQPFDYSEAAAQQAKIISDQIKREMERCKYKSKTRKMLRNCAVSGDGCFYHYFEPDVETGQLNKGVISVENIDNVNILFGNPFSYEVQKQPYILIVQRRSLESVQEEAEMNGLSQEAIDSIRTESDDTNMNDDDAEKLCTVIIKMFKEAKKVQSGEMDVAGNPIEKEVKSVHYIKVVNDVVLKKETDLEYSLYPVAYMNWEETKNCYHGRSPITGLIPNQIYVNKLFAMSMMFTQNNAFPRLLYDGGKIEEMSNAVNEAFDVDRMDLAGDVLRYTQAPDFSSQVLQLIDTTIERTRDFLGASDAALGNVKPDNTSAIIATQQATAIPLELQRLNFYDFVEDSVRILIDMMSHDYGTRMVMAEMEDGSKQPVNVDFSVLQNLNYDLNIEIGRTNYWSEIAQTTTMDNLLNKGVLTDIELYLESIPDSAVSNKAQIIENVRKKMLEQQQQAQAMALAQAGINPTLEQQLPADIAGLV
nr:MAG TPA: portal protein [Caudoviricetes sp.]